VVVMVVSGGELSGCESRIIITAILNLKTESQSKSLRLLEEFVRIAFESQSIVAIPDSFLPGRSNRSFGMTQNSTNRNESHDLSTTMCLGMFTKTVTIQ